MRIILLGPPGSGKGTQAASLSKKLSIPHIATGDLLRDEVAKKSPLGVLAKGFMDKGELVPDYLVVRMVASRLGNVFLLDGFPRSLGQAQSLEVELKKKKLSLDAVVNLAVSDDAIISRLGKRRVCPECKAVFSEGLEKCASCGAKLIIRPDDNPATVRERLRVYREKTKPLEDFYARKKLVVTVDGQGAVEDVQARILSAMKARSP